MPSPVPGCGVWCANHSEPALVPPSLASPEWLALLWLNPAVAAEGSDSTRQPITLRRLPTLL